MNKRALADKSAVLKAVLLETLSNRDGYAHMDELYRQTKNGWSSDTYENYAYGTRFYFNNMKCVAATADATRLLEHAARSLPDDMDVFDMSPEMPSAMLLLAEPVMSGAMEVRAFAWLTIPSSSDPDNPRPPEEDAMPVVVVMTISPDGSVGMKNWQAYTGRTFANMKGGMLDKKEDPDTRDYAIFDIRVVIAFNLLLAQQVVETEKAQPTRQMRRQASRHQTPLDPVVIVQLPIRHHTHTNGNGAVPVDWSHRWIVSGHWRKQWYPTTETHRPKWIAPHIKGPDDKPLVVKEKLYVFDPKPSEE